MQTIIKGAIYRDANELVRPHFSGDMYAVDCTEYKTEFEMRNQYAEKYILEFMERAPITYQNIDYYECESGPHNTAEFELLSNIENIEFFDGATQF
jgi:hypothetical protein